ncbi:hypothetical protein [Quadrisphaera sp. KR29]|uniref:hypothetical protein n=1 Tax=Quadrisphaera sp. KR29 TaxID=3461391 RepID=UPI0040441402
MSPAPAVRSAARQLLGRAGWNVADQVLVSATNLVLSSMVALALTREGFGAFAVAFTVYSLMIGGGRALVAQPLVVRHTADGTGFREAAQAATGASALLGLASGLVAVVVGLTLEGDVGPALVAIGLLLPGLLLQDMWRLVFIAQGLPARAFVVDAVWAGGQLAAVAVVRAIGTATATSLLAAWGLSALVAALVGGWRFRGHPRVTASARWLASHRDLLGYYVAGFLTVQGANQVALLLIAGVGSPADNGALRAAQVVLGPLNLLTYALSAFAMPEVARRRLSGRPALLAGAAMSAVLVTATLLYGALALLVPDAWGEAVLGESWETGREVLLPSLVGVLAIAAGFGASTLLLSLGYARQAFWATSLLAPGLVGLGVGGLVLGGAPGAALGLSLAQVVVAPVQWVLVVVLVRRGATGRGGRR